MSSRPSQEKYDLLDLTFVIPVRIDSLEREENIKMCLKFLNECFITNILVLEADVRPKLEIKRNDELKKIFVEDFDLVFHRTKYINIMIELTSTNYVAVWDTDVLISPSQLLRTVERLRESNIDFILPYDGRFLNIPTGNKLIWYKTIVNDTYGSHFIGLTSINGNRSLGGAYLVKRSSYTQAGMENENFYGWGLEAVERVKRLEILGHKVERIDGPLFHLDHLRGRNSGYSSSQLELMGRRELQKVCSMTPVQLKSYVSGQEIRLKGPEVVHDESSEYEKTEYLIFNDRKLVYLVTSKVACTSIKTVLGEAYSITTQGDIHSPGLWANKMVRSLGPRYKTYFKFSFVRNPFDRIVSCYRNRVLPKRGKHDVYYGSYFEIYYEFNYIAKIRGDMSFDEFVKSIVKVPHHLADRHFKSQYSVLYSNKQCKVDFVGKYETLDEDWGYLANKFNFNTQLPRLNKSNQGKMYWEYYNPELIELVFNYYKDDILTFGYESVYSELKSKIN